ncbi:MAG: L-lactate dehydrogenase 1 [Candidatus Roizmanbacteria bacterium GW2011_GWA2_35_19]|uniref:L-lactate dehydrogenase n=1 Tax=Candidatus Roizmanbacteria bacterium GW2011_GWA2_35_19 TaxID=1618478 RepID=A0A0G0BPX5_9BACT|nr:MAG: L-lactate dehydrogenase 1 [Candidatus Roizmanbacteria bacterium GW2011_GWA2_35_19]
MKSNKVVIIGGGRVGMSAAFAMLLKEKVGEIVLYDRDIEKMKGEQLEFEHSLSFLGSTKITVASSNNDFENSDVIVFTAGVAQKPGESRLELVQKNTEIVKDILPAAVSQSPNAVLIMVTNPVDVLTYEASKILNLPKGRIFGTGTSLDTSRFRFHLSEILKINTKNIHAYILGEHGDSSFPVVSNADVGGQQLLSVPGINEKIINDCYIKVKEAAQAIIQSKGATYYAIAVVVSELVEAVLSDSKRVYPVSVPLDGQYGLKDVALSVPCVIGRNGVEEILEIDLSSIEKQNLDKSSEILKEFNGKKT